MYNEKNKRGLCKKLIPEWVIWYALFLVVVIFWHLLMREYSGDAVNIFSKGLDSDSLINILKNRYETWSSRVFAEAILYILSRNVVLWKVCNIAIYALFAYSLLSLTDFKHPRLVLGLWITYPIVEMSSAGWIATYMNYLWPLAIGMYALIPLHKFLGGEAFVRLNGLLFRLQHCLQRTWNKYACFLYAFCCGLELNILLF